ncbi:hypothetical protein ACJ41O_003934 [Fusarium nematophilum]
MSETVSRVEACSRGDNSTDCLLGILIEIMSSEADEYNWDPLTFAFTLLIGIIAVVFAGAAILQAVLVARRGEAKSSARVIGPWADQRTRSISWLEGRFRTTAGTPLIKSFHIFQLEEEGKNYLESTGSLPEESPAETNSQQTGWLRLLSRSGAATLWRNWHGSRMIMVDELPGELTAVPDQIGMISLAILAALAGCQSIETDPETKYPIMTGLHVQVRFTWLPSLGRMAVFEDEG